MNEKQKAAVKKARREVASVLARWGRGDHKDVHEEYGICHNLGIHFEDTNIYKQLNCEDPPSWNVDLVCELAKTWPKYSKSRMMPVPYKVNRNQWGKSANANARRELCLFLANKLRHMKPETVIKDCCWSKA